MKHITMLIVSTMLATSSCSIIPSSSGYEQVLESWMGADINSLISSWGPPSSQFNMPNGNVMYTWLNIGGTYVYTNVDYQNSRINSYGYTKHCETTFTVSQYQRITNWRWKGNSCRATKKKD